MPNILDIVTNILQNQQGGVSQSPPASASIPTQPGALNFQGLTVPGQRPGSLGSDQAINSILEQDMRGGRPFRLNPPPSTAIPTPPGALNFQGLTIPGQRPESLGSDQAINSILENLMRSGELPDIIKKIMGKKESVKKDIKVTVEKDGQQFMLPKDQLQEAVKQGYKQIDG